MCVSVCLLMHIYVCLYSTSVCLYKYMWTCMHVRVCTVHKYMHGYAYLYTFLHTHTCTYKYIKAVPDNAFWRQTLRHPVFMVSSCRMMIKLCFSQQWSNPSKWGSSHVRFKLYFDNTANTCTRCKYGYGSIHWLAPFLLKS